MSADRPIDTAELVDLTRSLVRVRSVHDPGAGAAEAGAAELVADWMRRAGWGVHVVEVAPGRPNVIGVVDGGGGPGRTLMFAGHTDVVTEGDRRAWSVDPYDAVRRDGRIYGRGAADMKGGLAAMLLAVRALADAGPFPGRVVVAALVDEEGLMLGSKHLADSEHVRGVDGVIVGEPEGGEICTCAKGAIRLRVDLTGVMAHGAMPAQARNPLPVAARLVEAVGRIEADIVTATGNHELLGAASITPTVLRGGDLDQVNVIPAGAVVAFDIRTIPGVDHAGLIAGLTQAAVEAAEGSGVDVRVTVLDDRPVVDTPREHPVVSALASAHEAVTGAPPLFGGVPGATDGTILTRDAGLATVVYGPGGKWIAHQADEYVEVADLVTAARVYLEAARLFLGAGSPSPAATPMPTHPEPSQ